MFSTFRINIYCSSTKAIRFKGLVVRTLNEKKIKFTLTSHIQDLLLFQAQFPSNSSKLAAKPQNEIKGFVHLNYIKQNHNIGLKDTKLNKRLCSPQLYTIKITIYGLKNPKLNKRFYSLQLYKSKS
jgi:hypothetical protein